MSEENHHIDVEPEIARVLHRIVRAMHDGECPQCHTRLAQPSMMHVTRLDLGLAPGLEIGDKYCRACGFTITQAEEKAAIAAFAPPIDWKSLLQPRPAVTLEEFGRSIEAPAERLMNSTGLFRAPISIQADDILTFHSGWLVQVTRSGHVVWDQTDLICNRED